MVVLVYEKSGDVEKASTGLAGIIPRRSMIGPRLNYVAVPANSLQQATGAGMPVPQEVIRIPGGNNTAVDAILGGGSVEQIRQAAFRYTEQWVSGGAVQAHVA